MLFLVFWGMDDEQQGATKENAGLLGWNLLYDFPSFVSVSLYSIQIVSFLARPFETFLEFFN